MKRWDIKLGVVATAVAILGLSSSILTGNEEFLFREVFGTTGISEQKTLLFFACVIGAMTGLKWWQARRNGDL